MSFHVGQKVARHRGDLDYPDWSPVPRLHETVTISNIYECAGELMLEIAEYPAPRRQCPRDENFDIAAGFIASYFRPITEKKADISIFKQMETPKSKQLERA